MEKVSSLFDGKLNILVSKILQRKGERERLFTFQLKNLKYYLWMQINNAGTSISKTALEYTEEDYGFVMSTNLESAFHLSQLAHPLLKASGVGRIVFISSIAGLVGIPEESVYGSTKGK